MNAPIVIIGGGLAGIIAARTLKDKGIEDVLILEKSRSVGGRLATRRIEEGIVDHGAQFFTIRSEELKAEADNWLENGWIREWYRDPYPRYISRDGMNSLAKKLAKGLKVELNTRVTQVTEEKDGFALKDENGASFKARAVIITAPVPQAKELLHNSNLIEKSLDNILFNPCLVGLFHLSQPSKLNENGHIDQKLPHGVNRVVDHKKKNISELTTISVYMNSDWSAVHFDEDESDTLAAITEKTCSFFEETTIVSSQLKKWRYADAETIIKEPFLKIEETTFPLYIIGDSFIPEEDSSHTPRFESAFLSGVRVAEEIH